MSDTARGKILDKIKAGRYISAEREKRRTQESLDVFFSDAKHTISKRKDVFKDVFSDPTISKILASLLYWCEGYKKFRGNIAFVNSDSALIMAFLKLFRRGFNLEEKKFRARLHVHLYHSEPELRKFWAKITDIPTTQFSRSYQKKMGNRISEEIIRGASLFGIMTYELGGNS